MHLKTSLLHVEHLDGVSTENVFRMLIRNVLAILLSKYFRLAFMLQSQAEKDIHNIPDVIDMMNLVSTEVETSTFLEHKNISRADLFDPCPVVKDYQTFLI